MKNITYLTFTVTIVLIVFFSCEKTPVNDPPPPTPPVEGYQTENVIIVIMDGARYSETWGDSTLEHIPNMGINFAEKSVVITNFYNNGITTTVPGHTSITTSYYQSITNNGRVGSRPRTPCYWLECLQIRLSMCYYSFRCGSKQKRVTGAIEES